MKEFLDKTSLTTTRSRTIDRFTYLYDFVQQRTPLGWGHRAVERFFELEDFSPYQNILDVGCGTGSLAIKIAERYRPSLTKVTGVDASPGMIEVANRKRIEYLPVEFKVATVESLPFPTNCFDLVISTLVFHHLPTSIKRKSFLEIYRVLKPGKKFLMVDIGKPVSILSKILAYLLYPIEGRNMVDNVKGIIPELIKEAGFIEIRECKDKLDIISFISAQKPG